jgi:hypothetical protein
MNNLIPALEQDERLAPIINNFHNAYVGPEYGDRTKGKKVNLESLKFVS